MPQGIKYERKLNKWICDPANKGKQIPEELIPDSDAEFHVLKCTIQRQRRYTAAAAPLNNWIVCRPGEPIPECLKNHRVLSSNSYRSYDFIADDLDSESNIEGNNELIVTDNEGQNAIAEWIRYRPDEPMPVEFLTMELFNDFGCMRNIYKFWDKYNPGKPYPAYYKDHYNEDDKTCMNDEDEELCIIEQVELLIDLIIFHPEITEIPKRFMFKNWQKYRKTPNCRSFLSLWIEYRPHQPIPQCLQYDGCAKQMDHNTYIPPVLRWIQLRKGEPIPDCLKYDGWLTNYCKNYRHCDVQCEWPILQWVKYRIGEPIPEELLHQTPLEKIKHRLLYLWIIRRQHEPIPDALKYTDFAKDLVSIERFNSFYTCTTYLNLWLQYRPGEPIPSDLICKESLRPDIQYKDEDIYPPIYLWIQYNAKRTLLQHKPLILPQELLENSAYDKTDDKNKLTLLSQRHRALLLQLIIKAYCTPSKHDDEFTELPDLSLIPQELFVDNWKSQRDYQAQTPIQRMMDYCTNKKLIPAIIEQYGYEGWQQDILKYIYAHRHHWKNNDKNPYIKDIAETENKQEENTTTSSSYDSQDTSSISDTESSESSDSNNSRYSYFNESYCELMDTILQHSQLPKCQHCEHENDPKHPVYIFTDCDNLNLCAHCFSYLKQNSYPICDATPYTNTNEEYKAETGLSDEEEEHESIAANNKEETEETQEDSYDYDSSSYYDNIGKSDEELVNHITHRRHNSFGNKRLDVGFYSEESWLSKDDSDIIV